MKVSILVRCPYFRYKAITVVGERKGVRDRDLSSFQGCP